MSRKQFRPDADAAKKAPSASTESASSEASGPSNSEMQDRLSGALDPVQKFSDGQDTLRDPRATQELAAQATSGSAGKLPYLSQIEKMFGQSLGDVKAHVGGEAGKSSEAMGAAAYASGDAIVFRDANPSLELVAHEAAHLVQQRSGAATGVGKKGDGNEKAADEVADRVKNGESAADLLPQASGPSDSSAVQHYQEEMVRGGDARVSDTGKSIRIGSQDLYLTSDLLAYANNKLKSTGKDGSHVELVAENDTIRYGENTLNKVMPKFVPHGQGLHAGLEAPNNGGKDTEGNASDKFALWSDCGRSSAAVMGSQYNDRAAVYNRNQKEVARTGMKDRNITGAGDSLPGQMANQVYVDGMSEYLWKNVDNPNLREGLHFKNENGKRKPVWPKNALHARQQYAGLSTEDQQAVDKQLGINAYAAPDVGEGFTMSTEYDMPGAAEVPGKNRWNFHWAGVVAKDGADVISLENYAVTADYAASMGVNSFDFVDRAWVFEMYGTKRFDQSFHAQHLGSGTHGTKATTMRVRTQA
ncbi:MAG: DUF4157 domain-containing protein [Deltaproteobacteria bacterium]|nr:MAG: DUF4157 domain-containing protein [Deltaproteobacteria bacterium]